jgi:hypothetical protein
MDLGMPCLKKASSMLAILKASNTVRSGWSQVKTLIDVIYSYFEGKPCLNLWCDGIRGKTVKETVTQKKPRRETKGTQWEEELEDVFQQLKMRHGNEYSGPQLRLWAHMFIANTHDDLDHPPNVPLITGAVQ